MSANDKAIGDFQVGDTVVFTRCYSSADFKKFSALSGDENPLHHHLDYAAASNFRHPIVPLHLVAAPLSAIAGMVFPGHRSLYLTSEIQSVNPAYFDTDITYSAQVCKISTARHVLQIRVLALHGKTVLLDGQLQVQVRDDVAPDAWPESSLYSINNVLQDRWALITGATGHIGRAVSLRLAKAGWNLVLQGRQTTLLNELAIRCNGHGVSTKSLVLSLNDTLTLTEKVSELSGIEALIHCASPGLDAPLDELLAVNAIAFTTLADTLLPGMLCRQRGRLVLIGSSALQYLPAGWENYIAAKAAATAALESLHRKYASYGIHGVTVAPGFVETPFSAKVRNAAEVALLPEEVAETVEASLDASGPENYWWLETSGVRRGQYGFHNSAAYVKASLQTEAITVPIDQIMSSKNSSNEVETLVREFLRLPPSTDVSEYGLNLTTGWDSLAHIQLLLFLEERTGLHFGSHEIEQTRRVSDLKTLINGKRS
jgi:3-oxoacyl-[acyl-carrier protein] reductase